MTFMVQGCHPHAANVPHLLPFLVGAVLWGSQDRVPEVGRRVDLRHMDLDARHGMLAWLFAWILPFAKEYSYYYYHYFPCWCYRESVTIALVSKGLKQIEGS